MMLKYARSPFAVYLFSYRKQTCTNMWPNNVYFHTYINANIRYLYKATEYITHMMIFFALETLNLQLWKRIAQQNNYNIVTN